VPTRTAPSLTLVDQIGMNPLTAGANVSYTLTFGNTGTDVAHGTKIVAALPSSTSYVSSSGGAFDAVARTVTWTQNDLSTGSAGNQTLTVKVDPAAADGTVIAGTATISATNARQVTVTSTATVLASRPITLLDWPSVDPVAPGAQVQLMIYYANASGAPLAGATLTSAVPPGTTFARATSGGTFDAATGVVTWNLGTLSVGAWSQVGLNVNLSSPIPDGSSIAHAATLTAGSLSMTAQTTITVASAPAPSLTAIASAAPAGGDVTFTLAYTNPGTDDARDVVLAAPLPAGTTFVSATGGGTFDAVQARVTWPLGILVGGGSGQQSVTLAVDPALAPGTILVERASLSASNAPPASASALPVVVPPTPGGPVLLVTLDAQHSDGGCEVGHHGSPALAPILFLALLALARRRR
jgi:uncharacterized repeat protein (TIGR01451 family)/uncharacterized protein (TIGR03382 family)